MYLVMVDKLDSSSNLYLYCPEGGRGSTVTVFSLGLLPGLLFPKELGLHGIGGRLLWTTFASGVGDPKPLFFLIPL